MPNTALISVSWLNLVYCGNVPAQGGCQMMGCGVGRMPAILAFVVRINLQR